MFGSEPECTGHYENDLLKHDGPFCPIHETIPELGIQMTLFKVETDGGYTYYYEPGPLPVVATSANVTYHFQPKEKNRNMHNSLSQLIAGLQNTLTEVNDTLEVVETSKYQLEDAENDLLSLQEELQNIVDTVENLSGINIYVEGIEFAVDF